jgi:hypothetical protein
VRNPIVSTVLYLSEGVGGPTLMTNQYLEDTKLAARGWLAFPKLNRLVVFDGSYLHGVIPGRFQALVHPPPFPLLFPAMTPVAVQQRTMPSSPFRYPMK